MVRTKKLIIGSFLTIALTACQAARPEPTATPVPSHDPTAEHSEYPIAVSDDLYIHIGDCHSSRNGKPVEQDWWIYPAGVSDVWEYQAEWGGQLQIITETIDIDAWEDISTYLSDIRAHPDWYITLEDLDGDGADDIRALFSNLEGQWRYHAYLWNEEAGQFLLDEDLTLDTETHQET